MRGAKTYPWHGSLDSDGHGSLDSDAISGVALCRSSSRFGNSISASTDRKAELKASLDAHHVDRCLPAWDDMGRDQQIKLEAMGVPGLGNEDQEMDDQAREAMFERRNKVMALLEGVMAEG